MGGCAPARPGARVAGMSTSISALQCPECGSKLISSRRGPSPRYCSSRCRGRAYRARKTPTPSKGWQKSRRWVRAVGKRPIRVDGRPASSTKPETWDYLEKVRRGGAGNGFGVMLGGGLGCYDFDNCFSGGKLEKWAADTIRALPEKIIYAEKSVSGRGLHLFFEGEEKPGSRKRVGSGSVERYTYGRFILTTLKTFDLSTII